MKRALFIFSVYQPQPEVELSAFSYVWCDSFLCVTCITHRVPWLISFYSTGYQPQPEKVKVGALMRGVTQFYAWHASLIEWRDSFYLSQQSNNHSQRKSNSALLQHTATHCNTLQRTATHCNTLHHTATHCSTATHCHFIELNRIPATARGNRTRCSWSFPSCPSKSKERCISSKEPYIPSKDPYILSNEPYLPAKQPYFPSKESCIPAKVPYCQSKQPLHPIKRDLSPSKRPYFALKEPYIPSKKPYVPSKKP